MTSAAVASIAPMAFAPEHVDPEPVNLYETAVRTIYWVELA